MGRGAGQSGVLGLFRGVRKIWDSGLVLRLDVGMVFVAVHGCVKLTRPHILNRVAYRIQLYPNRAANYTNVERRASLQIQAALHETILWTLNSFPPWLGQMGLVCNHCLRQTVNVSSPRCTGVMTEQDSESGCSFRQLAGWEANRHHSAGALGTQQPAGDKCSLTAHSCPII